MRIPDRSDAEKLLDDAEINNPGLWVAHSKVAARCASEIAKRCPHLDPDAAYIMGLLHDIGRINGVTDVRHIINGYRLMLDMGYEDVAKVCLTHSFPCQSIDVYGGKFDIDDDDHRFLEEFIRDAVYDEYDRLIQLSDAMADPGGVCIIEQRLVNVAMRQRNLGEHTLRKWKAFLDLKKHFNDLTHANIYDFFEIMIR